MRIEQLRISGFKSIRDAEITLHPLNVVIGANGSGKSNLVSFFNLLVASLQGQLEEYIVPRGGPSAFLHLGPRVTKEIKSALTVTTEAGRATLHQRLVFQAPDNLVYLPEKRNAKGPVGEWDFPNCQIIPEKSDSNPSGFVLDTLKIHTHIYHFIDTIYNSPIRTAVYIEDNLALHRDGGNLAAMLFRLKRTNRRSAYDRIVRTVRQIAPFIDDFSLEPVAGDPTRIILNWKQIGTEYRFGPHHLSDGMLRAIALITVLLQPEDELPNLIIIDEPEIGLHPYALSVIGALLKRASHHTQLLVATHSPQLLDECEPEDVICAEREGQESLFRRLDTDSLREWLSEYSLGEIWQKNIIGGGPH